MEQSKQAWRRTALVGWFCFGHIYSCKYTHSLSSLSLSLCLSLNTYSLAQIVLHPQSSSSSSLSSSRTSRGSQQTKYSQLSLFIIIILILLILLSFHHLSSSSEFNHLSFFHRISSQYYLSTCTLVPLLSSVFVSLFVPLSLLQHHS